MKDIDTKKEVKKENPQLLLGKILANLRNSNTILYATLSEVCDINIVNNKVYLHFNSPGYIEECEKTDNLQQLNTILFDINPLLTIQFKLHEQDNESINSLDILKKEFDDLLIIQNNL